ncbi:MAG: LytTR family transcriptional regulator, partial [Bacteroidales bacterium]
MKKKIPAYLIEKGNIIKFLLFTAVFALIFLNIYIPFSSHSWLNVPKKTFFLYSGIVVIIGLVVLTFGRILMYKFKKYLNMTYGKYALWILSEMIIIALIYSTVIYSVVKNDQRTFLEILETATYYTFLVLFLP